jgi:hypothetical protein
MGHMYNNGMNTASKGLTVDAIRVTGLNVANGSLCTIAEDCKAGLISSVTHTALGTYTFQLSVPYPPKVVNIQPVLSAALTTSATNVARYQSASYNATTGQFIILLSTSAAAAVDGGATDELHVDMKFNRYTR